MQKYLIKGILLLSLILVGCAHNTATLTTTTTAASSQSSSLEKFNRAMFDFNYNVLDAYILRPVAVGWRNYVPQSARHGISNFLNNLAEPASMVNSFVEGEPYNAMRHFTRFLLNTFLGLGGFIDVAAMANPEKLGTTVTPVGFGTVLAHYDVPTGPYIVLPFYGSFVLRNDVGDLVSFLYPPLSYLTFPMTAGRWAVKGVETRAQLLDSDSLLKNSSDPYSFMKEAYFQNMQFEASGGQLKAETNPNSAIIQNELDAID